MMLITTSYYQRYYCTNGLGSIPPSSSQVHEACYMLSAVRRYHVFYDTAFFRPYQKSGIENAYTNAVEYDT